MRRNEIKKLVFSAMFLALAFVMPFLTGQIPQVGSMLCPMHIPVLLCGFFCGAPWGLAVGFIAPILRSFTLGMPPMFPTAFCMAFELATYGFVAGWLHNKLPKKKMNVYVSLLSAMVIGRLVWGVVMFCCMGLNVSKSFCLASALHLFFDSEIRRKEINEAIARISKPYATEKLCDFIFNLEEVKDRI